MASTAESQEGKGVSEKAAEMAKEEAQPSRKRARRAAHIEIQTPGTLPQYRDSKKYLSVTDFVSPLWCEYAFHYGILGLRHLPVSQRPKEIETPSGHILKPDKQVAQQREKVLVGGRKVHEKLEKEIHPVKVHVQTTTREDEWALRILRLITGLRTLLDSGCCREVPIFGFVHGELVMGVVDEINRRPLSKRLNKYLDEAPKEGQTPASKHFHTFSHLYISKKVQALNYPTQTGRRNILHKKNGRRRCVEKKLYQKALRSPRKNLNQLPKKGRRQDKGA